MLCNMRFIEHRCAIASEALEDRPKKLAKREKYRQVLSLAQNNVTEAQFRTDVGSEFQIDGTVMNKERLPKDVRLKETCSGGADDDRSDCMLLCVVMWQLRYSDIDVCRVL